MSGVRAFQAMTDSFADRLIERTRALGLLCVGIDPHPGRIPELFGGDTPAGLAAWGSSIVEAADGRVAVVKPQAGLFERHGPEGMAALQMICETARAAGLMVIIDAKRGDIGSTAEGYAAAWLASDAPFPCDALTVNPYLGLDSMEPFIARAELCGRGVAILARTSNPGSADFQSLMIEGRPLYIHVVEALKPMIDRLQGTNGWSGCMLVAGATGPDEARALRQAAPSALFLVPGYGAQGAGAAEALAGFVTGPNGLEGGIVSASRSVTFPDAAKEAETFKAWQAAIIGAIDAAQTDLSLAASRE